MAGGPLREFSIPAMAEIPATAPHTAVIVDRSRRASDSGVLGRREAASQWADVTARQFSEQARALAKGLIAAGVGPGDRVGLMARTSYTWTLIDYAVWSVGAVTVPVYETSPAEQVEGIMANSGSCAVFAENDAHAATITSVKGNLPDLQNIWPIDTIGVVTAAGAEITDDQLDQRMAGRTADDLATIIYPSGPTGRPKGCELTHRNLLSGARNAVQGALHDLSEVADSSTLLFLPLAHVFARIIQVACLEGGAVLEHWEDSSTLAHALPETRPVFLLAVPRVFEKVYNSAQQQAAASGLKSRIFLPATDTAIAYSRAQSGSPVDGSGRRSASQGLKVRHALFDRLVYNKLRSEVGGRVKIAVSGGAPLGERLGHFFRGAGITVLEGYGLTETSAAAVVNRPIRNKIGTVGLPIPGTTVRIADDGEILIGGPTVFRGYWRNEEATAEALDSDRLMRTGDIGPLGDGGFLTLLGPKQEPILKASGKNSTPCLPGDRTRTRPL